MTPDLWPVLVAIIFPGLVSLASPVIRLLPSPYLAGLEMLLALVPALAWIWFYRRQDRTEKEPLVYVLASFVAGALMTGAVGAPLVRAFFTEQDWPYQSTLILIGGSVLIPGIILEAVKYLAVRYTVYLNPEFSEPLDGIVYCTAAGLGAATALNLAYIAGYGGVDPTVGAIMVSVQTMGQAAFAGITGYALGAMKFDSPRNDRRAAGALLVAALLNGLFFWALEAVSRTGLGVAPWRGLLLAGAVAAAVSWTVYRLIGKARAGRGAGQEQALIPAEDLPAVDRYVILTAVLMLALGLGLGYTLSNRTVSANLPGNMTLSYPEGWRVKSDAGWQASNPRSGSAFTSTFSVIQAPAATAVMASAGQSAPPPLADMATQHLLSTVGERPFFREISFEEQEVAGRPAAVVTYLYVADPLQGRLTGSGVPVVVRGVRAYSLREGKLAAVGFETAEANWKRDARVWAKALAGLNW